jgi:hypothetical protein
MRLSNEAYPRAGWPVGELGGAPPYPRYPLSTRCEVKGELVEGSEGEGQASSGASDSLVYGRCFHRPLRGWGMPHKYLTKPEVADGQRYRRFVAMTQRMGALDDVKGFEKAFKDAFETASACWRRPAGHQTNGPASQHNVEGT